MPTVELPAHNVGVSGSGAEISGGSGALSARGTGSSVRFNWSEGKVRVFVGFGDTLGHGLWTPPTGAVVEDVRFIAEGYLNTIPGDPVVPVVEATYFAWNGADHTNTPLVNWPLLTVGYDGDPWSGAGDQGYNISTFVENSLNDAECAVQLQHLIGGDDYVIAGIGTPDTGTDGLRPQLNLPEYPGAAGNVDLILTYLAIRITYSAVVAGQINRARRNFTGSN